MSSAGPPSRRSSPSATWRASRCSRTRRRTRRGGGRGDYRERKAFEPRAIPAVVFTDPEVAWCGLTETEAKKQGRKVKSRSFPGVRRAGDRDSRRRADQAVLDPETERILGVGIVGSGAGELIAEGVLAIEMGATAPTCADDPSASDAVGNAHGGRRGVLRPDHARLQAEEEEGLELLRLGTRTGDVVRPLLTSCFRPQFRLAALTGRRQLVDGHPRHGSVRHAVEAERSRFTLF